MSTPRERLLAEALKDKLISIQKSKQIYKQLSKLERKILKMDEKEKERTSKIVASKVDRFFIHQTNSGHPPSPEVINKKISEELQKI